MASIHKRKRTTRVIAYADRRRLIFPLGRATDMEAQQFADRIDRLIFERSQQVSMSADIFRWISGLNDDVYSVLAKHGLVEPRVSAITLGAFIDEYIERRTDVSERRQEKLGQARSRILEYLPACHSVHWMTTTESIRSGGVAGSVTTIRSGDLIIDSGR